jgi:small subunit ribosomal protein S2
VVGILDSNSSPESITYPVPGNDDATRAIRLYCQLIADAALDGLQESHAKNSADIGASAEVPFSHSKADDKMEAVKAEKEAGEKPAKGKKHDKHEKKAPVVVKKQAKAIEGEDKAEDVSAEATPEAEDKSAEKKPAKKGASDKPSKAKKAS